MRKVQSRGHGWYGQRQEPTRGLVETYSSERMRGRTYLSDLTAIDVFSGCGGMTEGLKQAGFRVVAAIDCDPEACAVYEANHPEVTLFEKDIREADPCALRKELGLQPGQLHLLAGCPPCQGFSTLRTRNRGSAVDDPRNDLLSQFLDWVKAFKPQAVLVENVPGLARDRRYDTFADELRDLEYQGACHIVDAAEYGVPQRRKRMVYAAVLKAPFTLPKTQEEHISVRQAIGHLAKPGSTGDSLHDIVEHRTPRVIELISLIPADGGSRSALPPEKQLACHQAFSGFRDVYGRMWWDKVSPTITSGCFNPSKGRFLHPEQNRAITMREAALLQGFPDDYQFPLRSKIAIARLVGNAVPPQLVRSTASAIAKALRGRQVRREANAQTAG